MKRYNMIMRLCMVLLIGLCSHLCGLAAEVSASSVEGGIGEETEFSISLDNAGMSVIALQMDVTFPTGIAVAVDSHGKPSFAMTSRGDTHNLSVSSLGGNAYRLVVFSSHNDALWYNSGSLITCRLLLVDGVDGNVTISNIKLTDADLVEHALADVTAPVQVTVPHMSAALKVANGVVGEPQALSVALDADGAQVVAFQFDLLGLPGALDLQLSERVRALTLGVNKIDGGYRVVAYSATNQTIIVDDGDIVVGFIKVDEPGSYEVRIDNFKVTDSGLREYAVEPVHATFEAESQYVEVEAIELSNVGLEIKIGESFQLTAKVLPENATDQDLTWSTSDASVATVTDSGFVTGVSVGVAVITVKCARIIETCEVRVVEVPECERPTVDYNGRYMRLSTQTQGATIRFTLDGSDPTEQSAAYEGEFDTKGIVLVRAAAFMPDYNPSPVVEYMTPAYADSTTAIVAVPGVLSTAFRWTEPDLITEINIMGELDVDDLAYIRTMQSLERLYMDEAHIAYIPDTAFAHMPLRYIRLPYSVEATGAELFRDCSSLCAVAWLSDARLSAYALSGFDNPNALVYVNEPMAAPDGFYNVIVNGYIGELSLVDGYDFDCPEEFTVGHISYTHEYAQETPIGGCAGWETICLPFDVEHVTHANKGEIKPFATLRDGNYDQYKPYWLYGMNDSGFAASEVIKAYTPYVISMPNNVGYADEYILAGAVTFEAYDSKVLPTESRVATDGVVEFVPTTMFVANTPHVYALNVGQAMDFDRAGSVFVRGLCDINPFEAYITVDMQHRSIERIRVSDLLDGESMGVVTQLADSLWSVVSHGGNLYISSGKAKTVFIYTVTGVLVRQLNVDSGVTVISDLPPGLYVVDGTKLLHR